MCGLSYTALTRLVGVAGGALRSSVARSYPPPLLALALLASGCALDVSAIPEGDIPPDAGPDTSSDVGMPDGDPLDTTVRDGDPPDTNPPDTNLPDTNIPDGGFPCESFSAEHFDACMIPEPGPVLTGSGTFDTTTGELDGVPVTSTMIDQGGTPARLISVSGFTVPGGSTFRVVGSMPLIVASWTHITIDGDIDVGSAVGGVTGAGANPSSCRAATSGAPGDSGSGGGGGGGFGGGGGNGGRGDLNGTERAGGSGGNAAGATPTIVRGGCDGADSGTGRGGGIGAKGAGAGAIQLTARTAISVDGRVLAGGAGGAGGASPSAAGGGGGGSGGYVGLDAPTVTVAGTLAANGGGGGGGTSLSEPGFAGDSGRADAMRAAGGSADIADVGTDGGRGGAGSTSEGETVTGILNGGGGGGGGGVGFVLVFSGAFSSGGAVMSPDPVVSP